jgi:transcriptional regulator with XRE-family HTH domain
MENQAYSLNENHLKVKIEPTKIKQVIKKNGLKFYYVADCLSLNPTLLSKKLNGERPFLPEELASLANLLQIGMENFFKAVNEA